MESELNHHFSAKIRRAVNLLPWRTQRFRQRSIKTLLGTTLAGLSLVAFWFVINLMNEQLEQQVNTLQNQLQQRQNATSTVTAQLAKLRQEIQPQQKVQAIDSEQVFSAIDTLAELPLEQGELTEFSLSETGIRLQGNAVAQSEFEQLHQFLEQQFSHVKLTEFLPHHNGKLHFQFEILNE